MELETTNGGTENGGTPNGKRGNGPAAAGAPSGRTRSLGNAASWGPHPTVRAPAAKVRVCADERQAGTMFSAVGPF
ncbi:hypothetical protein GCM10023336_31280 [Streptomyces similanensis]|uniref:Uncharacterized protein n=1 Tax=Streptomyces similanensis TaxID=1274988 RepID=A0ABP9KI51_9ACTN